MTKEIKKAVYLTADGFMKLESELDYLKKEKRLEVIKALKEARALGDLSENSEYDAARNEQALVEARIREIEITLENATIIQDGGNGTVSIGTTVTLKYDGEDDCEEYKIVGSQEADPMSNKISNESPIAKAIMGSKQGDIVEVESPTGKYKVEVVKVC